MPLIMVYRLNCHNCQAYFNVKAPGLSGPACKNVNYHSGVKICRYFSYDSEMYIDVYNNTFQQKFAVRI